MKVIQLIDSLETGGAERVSVNYANGLVGRISGSFLCATRAEGGLKDSLSKDVGYLFLNKKRTLDVKAIIMLRRFIKENDITIIHAHSSSYFLATLIKFITKGVTLVWHDHYGKSEFLDKRPITILRFCSWYFSQIISVNQKLADWAKAHLKSKAVTFLSNFAVLDQTPPKHPTILQGEDGKRIVCLANLRPQKDHFTLLAAYQIISKTHRDWSLHLVGKNFNDDYALAVKRQIKALNLEANVFLYESKTDIANILSQCDIGVLSSKSEGLPVALLEYGMAKKAVIVTDVGECGRVVDSDDLGRLVNAEDSSKLAEAMHDLINDTTMRTRLAENFHNKITKEYSINSSITSVIQIYTDMS